MFHAGNSVTNPPSPKKPKNKIEKFYTSCKQLVMKSHELSTDTTVTSVTSLRTIKGIYCDKGVEHKIFLEKDNLLCRPIDFCISLFEISTINQV